VEMVVPQTIGTPVDQFMGANRSYTHIEIYNPGAHKIIYKGTISDLRLYGLALLGHVEISKSVGMYDSLEWYIGTDTLESIIVLGERGRYRDSLKAEAERQGIALYDQGLVDIFNPIEVQLIAKYEAYFQGTSP